MRVAVVYLEKIPEVLLRVLGHTASIETALFTGKRNDEDFLSLWHPEVILYELEDEASEQLSRRMLAHARHAVAGIPAFSFSSTAGADMRSLSMEIGFINHLEALRLTPRELELHLQYGLRLARIPQPAVPLVTGRGSFDKAFEAVTSFHSSLDQAKVVESAMLHLPRLVPADTWALYLSTESGDHLNLVAAVNASGRAIVRSVSMNDEENPLVQTVREEKSMFVIFPAAGATPPDPVITFSLSALSDKYETQLLLPLLTNGNLCGVMMASLEAGTRTFTAENLDIAERVSASLAVALGNAISFTKAESMCQLDDLTSLYNARFFYQALDTELKRSRRYGLHLAVIFLDLDGFKGINDQFGHLVGSNTLVEVGQLIYRAVRETDVVARYGGDEFVIVLPETNAAQAFIIAERIRARIEATTFQKGRGLTVHLTCSLGISAFPEHGTVAEDLVKWADQAMYNAKQGTKNQVVVVNLQGA
ncbi:MAG TPA: sensor domain-containing diguanylate cyclase [Acidobacteriota bacterium]|nr:sensor domain-containing diguanylate cyclase [Acidobacteriota bacterium]HNB70300.1 sensor domain-containing diguanylate cyclase [Acidobacteriota bacterium]HNJ40166.1 sensor domain-containing diguanylate cyclase [Acidobacteriota bacterium]